MMNQKGKAFIVVGHSNWGKSFTLISLTGSRHKMWIKLNEKLLKVKKMSNDDIPKGPGGLLDYVEASIKSKYAYIVLALCPNFVDADRETEHILQTLSTKYDLFFWVMRERYGDRATQVTEDQINRLKQWGTVEVFEGQAVDTERATRFKKFIEQHLT